MPLVKMTAKTLNALKGWPQQSAVDFAAKLDPSVAVVLPPGTVVHLSADLTYLPGVANLKVMPLFTFSGSDDADVINADGGDPAVDKGAWVPVSPSGNMMALVAVGAYELVSTNYDTTDEPYAPNDHLTSLTVTAGAVLAGMLTKGVVHTNTICGVVSRGVINNGYGTDALAFWPVYIPSA